MRRTLVTLVFLLVFSVGVKASYINGNSVQFVKGNPVFENILLSQSGSYTDINPEDGKYRLENEDGIILLDVRTPGEHLEMKHFYSKDVLINREGTATG